MKKKFSKRFFKGLCALALSASMVMSSFAGVFPTCEPVVVEAATNEYELVDDVQNSAILHCWNWSYETIEDHLELIAQCGYSAIQTSPVTQPKDYIYDGVVGTDVGTPGVGGTGNWWKVYQPVTISVCDNGQTWFGTKEELESLCAKAEEYGIKVIVDVVANHMGNIKGWKNSLTDVSPQVGEYWNPDMLTDESYWHINDLQIWMSDGREHFTQGTMGMPDLNTADARVQKYFKDYLIELIDCGVDGFRFDAAKHIETPDDDSKFASDFWPNVLNPAESHYKQKTGGDLYVYGEILNTVGDGFDIGSYTKYMSVTDNGAGGQCLDGFRNDQIGTINMHYDTNVSLIWAESHDTYMNESSRYGSDKSVVRTWSYVANKNGTAALYFVRPYYSKDILKDDKDGEMIGDLHAVLEQAQMGECSTYTWASNEVAAINHFRNRMNGKSESYGSDGRIGWCKRGDGIILINMDGAGSVSMSAHGLADGTYTDEVSRNTFTVSGGNISGKIESEYGIAVIYKNVMPNPDFEISDTVKVSSSVANGSVFYTDGLQVKLTARNATSASYKVSTGESGTFTDSKTITIGKGLSDGDTVSVTISATGANGSDKKTYTYTKQSKAVEINVSKDDGSVFYTDGFDVEIEVLYADSSSYSTSTGQKGTITDSKTITIGEGLSDGDTVTLIVKGTNASGTVTKTYTYTKGSNQLETAILFKNTVNWSTVYAYAWNDVTDKNAGWPGVPMTLYDEANKIYMIEFDTANQYENIIFNNGSAQTADLIIPGMGYVYDYITGSWSPYKEETKPTISSTLAGGEIDGVKNVTFTVKDATSATYKVNGGSAVSFSGSVTLKVGNSEKDVVVITATNSAGTTTKTYTYTKLANEKLTATSKASTTKNLVGETVKFTATAEGGLGSYKYSYIVYNKTTGEWARLKDKISSNTYTWTAKSAGTRVFYVDVTDSTGETVRCQGLTVTTDKDIQLTATSKASVTSTVVGDKVTFTATAKGGSGSYKYSYIVYNKTTGKWARLKDKITSNTYTWKAGSAGTREFYVDVTDSTGKTVRCKAITVKTEKVNPVAVVGSATASSIKVGDTVKIIGTASGGTTPYTYSFVVYNEATKSWYRYAFSSSNTRTWKAGSKGMRTFYVEAKDANGNVKRSNAITINVK